MRSRLQLVGRPGVMTSTTLVSWKRQSLRSPGCVKSRLGCSVRSLQRSRAWSGACSRGVPWRERMRRTLQELLRALTRASLCSLELASLSSRSACEHVSRHWQ